MNASISWVAGSWHCFVGGAGFEGWLAMRWALDWSCEWLAGCDGLEVGLAGRRSRRGSVPRTASRPAAVASGPGWWW